LLAKISIETNTFNNFFHLNTQCVNRRSNQQTVSPNCDRHHAIDFNSTFMESFFNSIIEHLTPESDVYLYLFLFISAVIENLFPPIPGDTITAFGAFLVGTGRLSYVIVYLVTTVGSVVGFLLLFFIGKYLGREFFLNRDYKYFPAEKIGSAEKWFLQYGYLVVLANRFLPGIRSVISIVSGILMLNTLKVFLYALISASIWNLIWIHTGYLLGENWDIVKEKIGALLRGYNIIVSVFMALALISFLVYRKIRKRPSR